jgi:hypothetical protein
MSPTKLDLSIKADSVWFVLLDEHNAPLTTPDEVQSYYVTAINNQMVLSSHSFSPTGIKDGIATKAAFCGLDGTILATAPLPYDTSLVIQTGESIYLPRAAFQAVITLTDVEDKT